MEVDPSRDLKSDDGRDHQVDCETELRPPPCTANKLPTVLPKVFDTVAGEADNKEPRRSGDARGREHNEDRSNTALNQDHVGPAISNREADVYSGDQDQ